MVHQEALSLRSQREQASAVVSFFVRLKAKVGISCVAESFKTLTASRQSLLDSLARF